MKTRLLYVALFYFYCLFAFGQSPGGVGVEFWLKADVGVTETSGRVNLWQNQGTGSMVTEATNVSSTLGGITKRDSSINFNPTIYLDGTSGNHLSGTYGFSFFPTATSGATVIAVTKALDDGSCCEGILVQQAGSSDRTPTLTYAWGEDYAQDAHGGSYLNSSIDDEGVEVIMKLEFLDETHLGSTMSRNGKVVSTGSGTSNRPIAGNATFDIGIRDFGGIPSRTFNGYISELIFAASSISAVDEQKIQSYLALKYGISLSNDNDGDNTLNEAIGSNQEGDYVASNGSTLIWDASAAATGFTEGVFGIGRDDSSGLNQRISKSVNTDGIITLATTDDFLSPNENGSRTSLNHLNFLTISNNGGTASWTTTGAPVNMNILPRQWQVQETGSVDSVHIAFDVDDADFNAPALSYTHSQYFLLVDTDNDGSFTDEVPQALENSSGSIWSGSVNFDTGERFTLAEYHNAPGGVAGGIELWLKADTGTDVTTNGSGIGTWTNQIPGNISNVQQSTAANKPFYRTGDINFNPSIDFDGANDYLAQSASPLKSGSANELNVFFVAQEDARQFGTVFEFNTNLFNTSVWFIVNYLQTYHGAGGTTLDLNPTPFSVGDLVLAEMKHSFSNGIRNMSLGNKVIASTTTVINSLSLNHTCLGVRASHASQFFNGRMPEFIVYGQDLTVLERQKVSSYLALKYGNTLSNDNDGDGNANETLSGSIQEGDYVASNGTTLMWDASAATAGFVNDVFGLGRDDYSGIDQRVSKSESSDGILTIALDNNFTASNSDVARTTTHTTDLVFLTVSNNNGAATWTTTGAPTNMNILSRQWQVQKTGSIGSVNIAFEVEDGDFNLPELTLTGSRYYLIVDTDNDGSYVDESLHQLTNNSGNLWSTSITFGNANRFTVAEYRSAPAGVGHNLVLWLKSDLETSTTTNGASLSTWGDLSGNNNGASGGVSPTYFNSNSTSTNYNPTVSFNGANQYMNFGINNFSFGSNSRSTFLVAKSDVNTNEYDCPYSYGSASVSNAYGLIRNATIMQQFGYGIDQTLGTLSIDNTEIYSGKYNGTAAVGYLNGNATASLNRAWNTTQNVAYVGRQVNGNEYWDGEINEVIQFNSELSDTEITKIHSYLALKYGITLENTAGGTAGDYLLSSNATAWDASNESAYHNQVIGLVRDDASGLNQKQSKTIDDSLQIYIGGLASTNNGNASSFNNDLSSIVIGHNGDTYQSEYSNTRPFTPTNTEKPASIYARFEREWKITNTNFTNTFSLRFTWDSIGNFNVNDLRLLVDVDGDFSNADVIASGQNGISISSGSIIISGISTALIPANSTRFITIGTVSSSTPLPVSLTMFDAQKVGGNSAKLSWKTSSELNNSHFELERRTKKSDFSLVVKVDGNGTTNQVNKYEHVDDNLDPSTYFYRLKQVDFDGKYTYSNLRSIKVSEKLGNNPNYKIIPNPANDRIQIQTEGVDIKEVTIVASDGKLLYHNQKLPKNLLQIDIDVSDLTSGVYYLTVNNNAKKLIINK